ncbi:MAG: HAD family hydrolase [Bacillota bacterium]|nr:HAD family hydrolase [Bacillota bacterium]
MKKYEGILLCTDVDGTLADRSGNANISRENICAVKYFMENGGLFTLATGRQKRFTKQLDQVFKINAPMIAINGTTVIDESGKLLYANGLPREAIGDIREIYRNFPIMRESHIRSLDSQNIYMMQNGEMVPIQESQGPWYKCIFLFEEEKDCVNFQRNLIDRYAGRYEFDRSWPIEVEMHAKGSGKGDAVRFLRKYYGNQVDKIICVGDYENDITMLEEADIGIAVENAPESVKAVADKITVSCDENAIAKIIYEL